MKSIPTLLLAAVLAACAELPRQPAAARIEIDSPVFARADEPAEIAHHKTP